MKTPFSLLETMCALAMATALGCDGAATAEGSGRASSSAGGGDAVAGTGGIDDGGDGGGGGEAPAPSRLGSMFLIRSLYASPEADPEIADGGAFIASFDEAPRGEVDDDAGCTRTVVGACEVWACDPTFQPPAGEPILPVSAGNIEVAGLSVPLVAMPDAENEYDVNIRGPAEAGWPFASGASPSFTAAGDVVPAFTAAIDAPARLRVTSPELGDGMVIDRDLPLDVEWTAGPGAGRVFVTLDDADDPSSAGDVDVTVYCQAEVADGSLHLPAEALVDLAPGRGAYFFVGTQALDEVDAGDWRVHVNVTDRQYVYGGVELR